MEEPQQSPPGQPLAQAQVQAGLPPERAAHLRQMGGQHLFLAFGGRADQPWLRLLRPGFRHCFAALQDARGWTVLDPLSGRLLVARLEVPPDYDLPRFYRRAGFRVLGPFAPAPAMRRRLPGISLLNCVGFCRAALGPGAPRAWTPFGLYRALRTLPASGHEHI